MVLCVFGGGGERAWTWRREGGEVEIPEMSGNEVARVSSRGRLGPTTRGGSSSAAEGPDARQQEELVRTTPHDWGM